ncbi:MAG: hypothetical protein C4536_13415 [Actinobacteria bacterium]|jgi:hypothetical protein|nr:MAG: hypothetical protein C4536_13415 [Actinomycetota bacterium]
MQEDKGQQITFMGRWRGRRLWILIGAAVIAAALVLFLVWAIPSSESDTEREAQADQDSQQPATEQPATEQEADGEEQQDATAPGNGAGPTMTPGTGGDEPGMVVDFPDPAEGIPAAPPGGYKDIHGHWILDMSGSVYGIANCHIILEENGTISSPPDYVQVFEIAASSYTWADGDPSFTASLQLMLKMGSSPALIPVHIELRGDVSESLQEIGGDFIAEPQGETYAPYAQQGTFAIHR